MDWHDVEKRLVERVEEVCRHLLPAGKREGGEWVAGNIDGHPGRSLKVNLNDKAGLWRDFAGDKGGKTLVSLWCSVRAKEFKVCIVEAKKFLGLPDDWGKKFFRPQRPHPDPLPQGEGAASFGSERSDEQGAAWLGNYTPLTEGCAVLRYLTDERHLDPTVIAAYQIGQSLDGRAIVYPYFVSAREEDEYLEPAEAGTPTTTKMPSWLKFELVERKDGKKVEWTTRGPDKCLFGKPVIKAGAREVIITEGEKDAMAWASYGLPAVSVPFGAKFATGQGQQRRPSPNREWIERDWGWLENFEAIYVAMDMDPPGRRAAMDIVNEIGPRRCRLVSLPQVTSEPVTSDER